MVFYYARLDKFEYQILKDYLFVKLNGAMSSVLSFGPNVKYLDYDANFVLAYLFLKILRVFEDPKLKFSS